MTLTQSALRNACRSALARGLRKSNPRALLNEANYVSDASQILVPTVSLHDAEADLRQGNGNELESKFLAAHSSTALAVNTFGPFKSRAASFRWANTDGFTSLQFERKCPHWGGTLSPPNLDVVAESPERILAIESKCIEPLTTKSAKFARAYDIKIIDSRRSGVWFKEMQRLVEQPDMFRCLDAAQLVKHAFGLAHTFPTRPVTLLYLFWEPSDATAYPFFDQHRSEVARFAESVAGDAIKFESMSYPELWRMWDQQSELDWLPSHLAQVRARYLVPLQHLA